MRSLANKILLLAVLLLTGVAALADNIYKYQDENGLWHFTDRAPDDDVDFEVVYMEREREPRIELRREGPRHNPVYLLFNDFWGPVEVELKFETESNILSEPPLPARFVVPAQTEEALLGIGALDETKGFSYRLTMSSVPGKPISNPVEGMVILPPFSHRESYPISQGFHGTTTHLTPDSTYAVDLVMPVGTPIHAVRDGRVMDIEEDFNKGGTDFEKFADKANHVRILHEDGTMALYAHLDLASVFVRHGQRVRAGQMIARSGNTGFSSGPHLHFAIQQNVGMKLISIPFQFKGPDETLVTPESNMILQGVRRN